MTEDVKPCPAVTVLGVNNEDDCTVIDLTISRVTSPGVTDCDGVTPNDGVSVCERTEGVTGGNGVFILGGVTKHGNTGVSDFGLSDGVTVGDAMTEPGADDGLTADSRVTVGDGVTELSEFSDNISFGSGLSANTSRAKFFCVIPA